DVSDANLPLGAKLASGRRVQHRSHRYVAVQRTDLEAPLRYPGAALCGAVLLPVRLSAGSGVAGVSNQQSGCGALADGVHEHGPLAGECRETGTGLWRLCLGQPDPFDGVDRITAWGRCERAVPSLLGGRLRLITAEACVRL